MHHSRRRKKRPNYGIRTVEVMRGPNGFGFTISGQQPCILSCIVPKSPADLAGLRAGDFLISVNGISVSKITHDAVVNLIGSSVAPIKMTIAENYYSDSSDEELEMGRIVNNRKFKYMHRSRAQRMQKERGAIRKEGTPGSSGNLPMEEEAGIIEHKAVVGYLGTIEMPKQVPPHSRLQTVCNCIRKLRQEKRVPTTVLMTVIPTCLTLKSSANHILAIYPSSRLVYTSCTNDKESRYFGLVTSATCESQTDVSNSCHVFVTDPKLVDHNAHMKKAETFKITCTVDAVGGNCVEFPKSAISIVSLIQNMYKLREASEVSNQDLQKVDDNEMVANSPQPSASSNSDSGIGFRDDCGNVSDRILVVEFPAHRPLPVVNPVNKRPVGIDASRILLESLDAPMNNENNQEYALNNVRSGYLANNLREKNLERPCNNLNNVRAYENITIKNVIDKTERNVEKSDFLAKQNNEPDQDQRLTVRALPDHNNYSERAIDVPDDSPSKKSCESISLHSMTEDFSDFKSSVDNISVHSFKSLEHNNLKCVFKTPNPKYFETKKHVKRHLKMVGSCDNLVLSKYDDPVRNYKLSPKVYGVVKPNYSCEELNNLESADTCGFGSLQDLCSWNGNYNTRRNIAQSEPDVRVQRAAQHMVS